MPARVRCQPARPAGLQCEGVLGCHAVAQTMSEASHMIFKLDRHAVVSEVCVRVMGVDTKELV